MDSGMGSRAPVDGSSAPNGPHGPMRAVGAAKPRGRETSPVSVAPVAVAHAWGQ